jgi:hypothetical protein
LLNFSEEIATKEFAQAVDEERAFIDATLDKETGMVTDYRLVVEPVSPQMGGVR